MKLGAWLEKEGMTPTDLARKMNRPQPTVARYVNGGRIPEPPIMREIYAITNGEVTPNDFFNLPACV